MAYTQSYMPRSNITGPQFSSCETACAQLSRGYAALSVLERQCANIQLQEPVTRLLLFEALVTLTLLYGTENWGPSLHKANNWKDLKRLLVSMIGRI